MSDKTFCEPTVIDLWLRYDVDHADVLAALVALGDGILDELPLSYRDQPDSLHRRLVAWGYGMARIVGNTRQLGIYGDGTLLEDDVIVLPALAPFMQDGSRYIFRQKDRWDYGRDDFEGWAFHDGTVTRREVERIVEFEWVRR